MNRRRPPAPDLTALRLLAEQQLARNPSSAAVESDLLRQAHELELRQIELELQNDALVRVEAQRDWAEAGRDGYAELYDEAPAGYFSIGADYRITRANRAAGVLMGRSPRALLERPFEQFVVPEGQAGLRRFLADVFEQGTRGVFETTLFGSGRQVRIEANLDRERRTCRMIVTDIGDAAEREAARRQALHTLDCIGEGVVMCDPQRRILAVNPAFTRITGYLAEQALGRLPDFLLRPGAHPAGHFRQAMQQLERLGSWAGEANGLRCDGAPFVALVSLTAQFGDDGAIASFFGVFADITARKQAEAELRESHALLRKLTDHLQVVKEEERKRIAREIHDELGQNLLALRLDIAQLHARSGARGGALHQRVAAALDNVDATIRSVRGLMNDLRPPVLDLGLQAALEWLVAEFRKRSGIECRLLLPPEPVFAAIPSEINIVLFRSLQEALANVARHALASCVTVQLAAQAGRLTLTVADNGIGIASGERAKSQSFGLVGIGERVAALGGRFEVAPFAEGEGATLAISFALAL